MCTENLQERKELIYALYNDRKLSDLPKITQVNIFHNRDSFQFLSFLITRVCVSYCSLH